MPLSTSTPLHFRGKYCTFLLHYIYVPALVTSFFTNLQKIFAHETYENVSTETINRENGETGKYFDKHLSHFSCKNISLFQLHKFEVLLLFLLIILLILISFFQFLILHNWLDKTSIVRVSVWALGSLIVMAFLTIFWIFTNQTINWLINGENNQQINP